MFLPKPPSLSSEHLSLAIVIAVGLFAIIGAVFVSPWLLIAILLGAAAIWATYKEPMWTVSFLALWWPLEPFILKFIPDDIYVFARYGSEMLVYLLVVVVLFGVWTKKYHRRSTPADLPFLLFVGILIVSTILNALPIGTAFLGARQILRFVILFFVIVLRYPRRYWIRRVLAVMLVMAALQAVLGIGQTLAGSSFDSLLLPSERKTFGDIQLTEGTVQFWDPGQRVFGTMGRYDRLGTFLALALLIAVAYAYEDKERKYAAWIGAFSLLALPTIILTYSRSAWFGLAFGVLAIAFFKKDKRVFMSAGILAAVFIGYLLVSDITKTVTDTPDQTVVERLSEAFSYYRFRGEYVGLGRVFWIIQTPLKIVPHSFTSFLFGWGPGQFGGGAAAALHNTRAYDLTGLPFGVYGTEGYIDNNWFSVWGEAGTLGFIFFIWLYLALFGVAWRVAKHSKIAFTRAVALAAIGVFVAFAVNALLATFLEIRTLAPYVWILAGATVVLGSRERILETRVKR